MVIEGSLRLTPRPVNLTYYVNSRHVRDNVSKTKMDRIRRNSPAGCTLASIRVYLGTSRHMPSHHTYLWITRSLYKEH